VPPRPVPPASPPASPPRGAGAAVAAAASSSAPLPPPPPPPAPAPAQARPAPAAEPPPEATLFATRPSQGLDPAVVQAVIARSRPELDACVAKALEDPVTSSFAGRKAALLLLVAPNGKAEAALEDGDLDASPFGACLRRAAGKMTFPPFEGEDVGARVVLQLGRAN
jgi:hypothetical protein